MASKENSPVVEIKNALENGTLIMGAKRVEKHLMQGKLKKLFLASNCSPELKKELLSRASLDNVEAVVLDVPNDELGLLCKKPFVITVVGIAKS